MNEKRILQQLIIDAYHSAVKDGRFSGADDPYVKVEYPKDQKFGDYATPFALELARSARKSPLEIGGILKEYMDGTDILGRIDVVKPGYINMFLSLDHLWKNLHQIVQERDAYGRNVKENPRRINVEFISANPTGPLNIVSARAAAIGDSIANILEANGDTVEREFYVNDFGNQVTLLGKSVLARCRELDGIDYPFPEEGYHGEYVIEIARHIKETCSDEIAAIDDEEMLISFLAEKAVQYNVSGQREDLDGFRVHFTRWFNERALHEGGDVDATYRYLDEKGYLYDQEGKKVFRSTDFGDDKDRVVVREDGRPTYLLADIAYHRNKIERGYDYIIDIWGPDHHGYIARLAGAMVALGMKKEDFRVLIAQQVNLLMEGQTVKMSKRLGNFSTMRELIEEIGVDVSRYFFVMRSLDSHLDFDLALAKKESSENPVFYLQYAHARICSLFREAEKRGIAYDPGGSVREYLDNPEAVILMKLMLKFPEEIEDAAEAFEPHRLTTYLLRLAQSFHRFYTEHRVLSDNVDSNNSCLLLADATRIVMKNGLALIGVMAPERM
ncbi:MAG: arginine--tRNA ligase [Spirochaetes bacterium]|nr:arginine--tRNA ligase [Spirochaetota bacterium]